MTSSAANDFARPSNWQDFERLSIALLSEIYATRLRRWGSAGQRKNGVDAWAKLADGRVVALRIEGRTERYGQPLTPADVDMALAEAADFPHPADEFILLSAGPGDAGLQAHAAGLSASRQAAGQSSVAVWGWPTIAAHIGQQPKVRGVFYGHEARASGKFKLVLLAAAVLVVAGGAGSLFLGKNAIDASQARPPNAAANVGNIAANLDELTATYQQCQELLGSNTFTFTGELIETCRDPAASQLAALSKKVDRQRSGFDAQVQAELARLLVIFHEDVREAVAVTSVAHAFDNEVVQSMKDGCAAEQANDRNAQAMKQAAIGQAGAKQATVKQAAVKQAGMAAAAAQVRYYYLLKDFIIPEMAAAREILQLHASGAPAPEPMKAAAGRMEQLLTARMAYAPKETRWPLTLSSLKHTAARDSVPGAGQASDAAEEARWRDVLAQSATRSLRGRAKDIDALIACGVLKEDARALAPAN
ncbi:hypothetical protein [Pseudoduganella albidiflava]|uniref:Uncharacterized protein n=1 Tax=Pseudoduganella albidiflava TaxID=321983 RepID=A0A411X539_9BURK|nr:hypothetical protein [Pseudoduganella albidiflava]QBI04130.1 hypothetical protein EYF70_27415 [Pseudoduganella albidiflava]GGY24924.1 hypothetical protein GCM10007387_03130 [Pseudoduganella albidiflava]